MYVLFKYGYYVGYLYMKFQGCNNLSTELLQTLRNSWTFGLKKTPNFLQVAIFSGWVFLGGKQTRQSVCVCVCVCCQLPVHHLTVSEMSWFIGDPPLQLLTNFAARGAPFDSTCSMMFAISFFFCCLRGRLDWLDQMGPSE